jgi:hypothetical protein
MMNFRGLRLFAGPILAAALVAPISGCSEDGGGLPGVECELQAQINNLEAQVTAFIDISAELKADVYAACAEIATAGGNTDYDPAATDVADGDVEDACSAAVTIIADFKANANATLTITGGECRANVSAEASCEASCQVDASCTEPELSVRCEGGELKGECSAECTGTLECSAEAGATVECSGTCEGTCEGSCDGTCSVENTDGSCAGQCEGTCEGECGGTCVAEVEAEASCTGTAVCEGECSVEMEAPSCEGELAAPTCEVEGECAADCSATAEAKAECTPPAIVIEADASADADVLAAIEVNLPILVEVGVQRGQALIDAFGSIAGSIEGVVNAGGQCAIAAGATLAGEVSAMAEASASVEVSVSASASASGEASSG